MFDRTGEAAAREAVDFCQKWSFEEPLWLPNKKGQFSQKEIPHLGKRSSIFAIAVLAAFLVWSQKGERQPAFESERWLQICYEGWRFHQRELQAQVAREDIEANGRTEIAGT